MKHIVHASDAVAVPLRGYLRRLRLLDWPPALGDVSPGVTRNLRSRDGTLRTVVIKDHSNVDGGVSRDLPESNRQPDLVIVRREALITSTLLANCSAKPP